MVEAVDPSKSVVTLKTHGSGSSSYSNLTSYQKTSWNDPEEEGRENGNENKEDSGECSLERSTTLINPTPKEILAMFKWKDENLYEHLKKLLEELISTRPENVIEYFDQYSREIRYGKPLQDPIVFMPNAIKLGKMYGLIYPTAEDEDLTKPRIADLWENMLYLEEMGVCLPREEIYRIALSLRKLALVEGLSKIRFWGKVFGLARSYIVAECELTYVEVLRRTAVENEQFDEEENEEEESIQESGESLLLDISSAFGKSSGEEFVEQKEEYVRPRYKKLEQYVKPPLPRAAKTGSKRTRPENIGEGANKNVYYVCHEPGDEWIPLPNAKPQHITAARRIRKYLKGNLTSKVESYPPFKGTEKELLRAQIARITASTQISPLGYYQLGGGEEAGEETEGLVANLDYEPIHPRDLLKEEFWVHHTPHILRIGRTTYWHEARYLGEEEEEEIPHEEEEEEEVGPPLLTPISNDVNEEMFRPWKIQCSSTLLPATGVIIARSNQWPGAFAFCKGRSFDNIYVGWGLKLCSDGFNPKYLPSTQTEYEPGPEVMELDDPSPETEEAWREAHTARLLPEPMMGGEGEESDMEGIQEEEEEEVQ